MEKRLKLDARGDRLELLQPLAHVGELDADADAVLGGFGLRAPRLAISSRLSSSQPFQARVAARQSIAVMPRARSRRG